MTDPTTAATAPAGLDGPKSPFASRTLWGAAIAILASLAGLAGVQVEPADQLAMLDLADRIFAEWDRIAAILGAGLAIWGRLAATRRIGSA